MSCHAPLSTEPFALELLRLFEQGATIAHLVEQTGIPEDRIVARPSVGVPASAREP
jgi:hypothetical protein